MHLWRLLPPWRGARLLLAAALLLATLLAGLPAPAPVAAADCAVTSTGDGTTGGTLRQRLLDGSCTAITITATGTINLQSTLPTITRALTIAGPGQASLTIRPDPAILLANRFLLLYVDASGPFGLGTPNIAVGISGLTLAGGRAKSQFNNNYGGDLRSLGANLTLTDVTLKDATGATDTGGAGAYISGGTVSLTRVTVSGNTAPGYAPSETGAGLFFDEYYAPLTATIADSTIVGNSSTTYAGGGLAVFRDSNVAGRTLSVTLANTTVGTTASPNTANSQGGGIYVNGGALTLTNSTVAGNTAASLGDGGGIAVYSQTSGGSATATLTNTTISGNTAPIGGGISLLGANGGNATATLTNSTVVGNTVVGSGGGIILNTGSGGNATATLTDSVVSGNSAGVRGGGIYASNSSSGGGGVKVTLTNSLLAANTAGTVGGALYVYNSASAATTTATLMNTTISGNTAKLDGGGVVLNGQSGGSNSATVQFSTVVANVADYDNNGSGGSGGLLLIGVGSLSVRSSIVAGNTKGTTSPSADNCGGGALTSQGRNLWGDHTTCPNNTLDGDQNLVSLNQLITAVLSPTLANNGGPTQTYALVASATNPAIDHGDNITCATASPGGPAGKDQRGFARSDGRCDVGAYEARTFVLATGTAGTGTGTVSPGGSYLEGQSVSVTATASGGSTFAGWTVDNAAAGTTNPLSVTMGAAHSVVATFTAPGASPSPSPSPSPGTSPSPSPSPSPGTSPSPSPSPSPGAPVTLTVSTAGTGSGTATPAGTTTYSAGQPATLTASPATGSTFTGWALDGTLVSWAPTVTLTMNATHTVVATFQPLPAFTDVPQGQPFTDPVQQLAARGIINGCFTDPTTQAKDFCPGENTLRHQMAALIARAMPGWVGETGLPSFGDNTDDTELMTRVATLQRHNVVRGYQADVCAERGIATPPGCYGPLDTVKYGQVMLFIARAMVEKGYWTLQPDDRTIFPDQNGAAGAPADDQQTLDHRAVVTYVHYVVTVPDVANVHANFALANGQGWGDAAPRAWFTRAFWPALQSYFGQDTVP